MNVISVIGGTGMLGMPVARAFKSSGYKVRVISRNSEAAFQKLGSGFEYCEANLQDVESLRAALKGTDGVHINVSGHSKKSYYESHVVGTKNIISALAQENIQCISMISTASAYPEYADRWDNHYKLEAETLLKKSGLPYLVFMPSWFMESLPLFQQKNKLVHIGPSTQPIHWLSAEDYGLVVTNAYNDTSCRDRRVVIYGPESLTMSEAINKFANQHDLKVQKLPVWIAKFIGKISRDESLVDVADLMQHYDRTGEKQVSTALRTTTKLQDWLTTSQLLESTN